MWPLSCKSGESKRKVNEFEKNEEFQGKVREFKGVVQMEKSDSALGLIC